MYPVTGSILNNLCKYSTLKEVVQNSSVFNSMLHMVTSLQRVLKGKGQLYYGVTQQTVTHSGDGGSHQQQEIMLMVHTLDMM
jgi:hypothetical protein